MQYAGSVSSALHYDRRVITDLWSAVRLQTGLLDIPTCIFVRLGSMVGGLERAALFSASQATRSVIKLVESTNLHVEGQVGIYNQEFGACLDTLCALTGREFVRASGRWVSRAGEVLKMDIWQFLSPPLDSLFAEAYDRDGGPFVVELDGSNILLKEPEGVVRAEDGWWPGCTAVLTFIWPSDTPDHGPYLVVDSWRDGWLVWSVKFSMRDVKYPSPEQGFGSMSENIHGVAQWEGVLRWVIPRGLGMPVLKVLCRMSEVWCSLPLGSLQSYVEYNRVLPGGEDWKCYGPDVGVVQPDNLFWWREVIFRGGSFRLEWVCTSEGVHYQGGPCPPGNFSQWAELQSDYLHRATTVVDSGRHPKWMWWAGIA